MQVDLRLFWSSKVPLISVSATSRCTFVVSVREDSPISDYIRWNAMHELRTAAMTANPFGSILPYFGQGNWVIVSQRKEEMERKRLQIPCT